MIKEEDSTTKKIVDFVANHKMVKYVQALELICFLLSGFFLGLNMGLKDNNFMVGAIVFILVGVILAIIAGESAIEEYRLEEQEDE